MRLKLRSRILLFTVLPIVALTVAGLGVVDHTITARIHQNLEDDLRRASAVLEDLLEARFDQLDVAAQVIVQDPRFFSVLTLPGGAADAQVRATVGGVAGSFNAITRADLFEVLDPDGRLIASVGAAACGRDARQRLLADADGSRTLSTVLVDGDAHYQVTLTPVRVGGHAVGWLLLGDRIGHELAARLKTLTRSEVTFVSWLTSTGSSFDQADDRESAITALRVAGPRGAWSRDGAVFETRAPSHRYLTLARELPRSEPSAHQTYVMQRALDTETAFLSDMQGRLGVIGVAALLLALLAGALISHRITSPVQRLVRAAEAMERGDYGYPLESPGGDELGYLTRRFGEMREHQHAVVQNLEQVARLRSEFISVASHELGTPVTVITSYHELMADGLLGPVSERQREALEAIGRSAATLAGIAYRATRMSQLEHGRLALAIDEHPVAPLVTQAFDEVRRAAGRRRVELVARVPEELGSVWVDGPRIVEALAQLVANGVRFTRDGGHVWVEAAREDRHLALTVRDDGIGIPPERLPLLFDTAATLSDSRHHHSSSTLEFGSRGLGLGLAIARGVAEAHGGTLTAESSGRGACFTLRLPVDAALRAAA